MDQHQRSLDLTTLKLEQALFGSALQTLKDEIAYDPRLMRMWQIIETEYSDSRLDLATTSRGAGMSPNNMNRILRTLTGKTFHELLVAFRVYQSSVQVQSTNLTFTEVALDNGFSDLSSYCRAVKRLLNVPPRELFPRSGQYKRRLLLSCLDAKTLGSALRDNASD
jgi:AraC-like DNA-binding protein